MSGLTDAQIAVLVERDVDACKQWASDRYAAGERRARWWHRFRQLHGDSARARGVDAVRKRDPVGFERVKRGETSIKQAVLDMPPTPRVARTIKQIRKLAARGCRSDQIAELAGLHVDTVRKRAQQGGVRLPDSVIGKCPSPRVLRVGEQTVHSLAGLAPAVDRFLTTEALSLIDRTTLAEWRDLLEESIVTITDLKTRIEEITR